MFYKSCTYNIMRTKVYFFRKSFLLEAISRAQQEIDSDQCQLIFNDQTTLG